MFDAVCCSVLQYVETCLGDSLCVEVYFSIMRIFCYSVDANEQGAEKVRVRTKKIEHSRHTDIDTDRETVSDTEKMSCRERDRET